MLYSQNRKLFALVNGTSGITHHQHNVGAYGNYYGTLFPTMLQVVFNEGAGIEKVWDNMVIHTRSDNNGIVEQFDTWNSIQVNSDTQNSGVYTIVPTNAWGIDAVIDITKQVKARRIKNKFTLTIPADVVIDQTLSIFDPTNQNPLQLFKPRIKGDHVVVTLMYQNTNNYKFIVNFIACQFRSNAS